MADREKIIKGLEHCIEKLDSVVNKSHGFNCIACPYFRKCDRSGCLIGLPLMRDALAMLKAQEPRVMHLADAQGTDYVWYESRQTGCVFPSSVRMSSDTWHGELTTDVQQIGYGGYKFVLDKEYNRAWRCWNHRPTDEQRQAIPWD